MARPRHPPQQQGGYGQQSGYGNQGYGQGGQQGHQGGDGDYPHNHQFETNPEYDHLQSANEYPPIGTVITTKKDQRLLKISYTALGMLIASMIWWRIIPWLVSHGVIPGV